MKRYALGLLLAAMPSAALAQFCSNCIYNQAALQPGAQLHVSSASVDGQLTVGTLVTGALNVGSITAGTFIGGGASLTALNASALASGTVSTSVVAGNYQGVTGVGKISSGTWNGALVRTQYGGTGQNWVNVTAGAIPYFVQTGTMGVVNSPAFYGVLIETGTAAPPVWVSSPALQGYNFVDVPLTSLIGSTLPANILVSSNSLTYVNGSSVRGDISGNAQNINGTLAQAQLSTGTLPTTIAASSVTPTGTAAGICGGPGLLCAANIHGDGRVYSWTQYNNVVYSTNIAPGPLPAGVTVAASQISSGTLPSNVIASSVQASGITAGTYGGVAKTLTVQYLVDGRASTVTVLNIALPLNQLVSGTLGAGVLVPATNLQAGYVGNTVIVTSVNVSGVTPGACGDSTHYCAATFGPDGRATSAAAFAASGSTSTVYSNVDNAWSAPQTFFSSITSLGNFSAANIVGSGSGIINLTPSNISGGALPTNVVASSVSLPYLTILGGSVTANAFFGDASHLTGVVATFSGGAVANVTTFASSVTVKGAGGILSLSSVTASSFFGDGSHLTGVVNTGVYNVFTASQAFPAISVTYGVVATTGVFSSSVSASGGFYGNLFGNASGSAGSVPASGVNSGALGSAVIASSVAVGAITNAQVVAGLFPSVTVPAANVAAGALATAVTVSTANVVPGFNGPNQFLQLTGAGALPAVSGVNLTNVASGKSGFLSGTNQTLGVGTFLIGYVNQAVTISSMSVIVTTSGAGGSSGTIWACCYGGSCVSVTSAQTAAVGSTYTGTGAVSVPAGGQILLQMTSTGEAVTPTVNGICGYQ